MLHKEQDERNNKEISSAQQEQIDDGLALKKRVLYLNMVASGHLVLNEF